MIFCETLVIGIHEDDTWHDSTTQILLQTRHPNSLIAVHPSRTILTVWSSLTPKNSLEWPKAESSRYQPGLHSPHPKTIKHPLDLDMEALFTALKSQRICTNTLVPDNRGHPQRWDPNPRFVGQVNSISSLSHSTGHSRVFFCGVSNNDPVIGKWSCQEGVYLVCSGVGMDDACQVRSRTQVFKSFDSKKSKLLFLFFLPQFGRSHGYWIRLKSKSCLCWFHAFIEQLTMFV